MLENQAQDYCQEHLKPNPAHEIVYAATMVAARIRLWKYHRHSEVMTSFWDAKDNGDYGNYDNYLDVGEAANRQTLEAAYTLMKSMPPNDLRIGMEYGDIAST